MSILDAKTLCAWLKTGSDDKGKPFKLLFTTMPNGTFSKNASSIDTQDKVIPSSLFFDFQGAFADTTSSLSNTMCSAAQFQKEAQRLGINDNDTLVVYDDYGNFCASRVWFMCKAMGCKEVYLLDGGLAKWISLAFDVLEIRDLASLNKNDVGNFVAKPNANFQFVGKQTIMPIALQSSSQSASSDKLIVDARGQKRFSGESPDPRPNVRSGHIPNSINLHYGILQDEWGRFLPKAELQALFSQAACTSDKTLIFSCGSGVTACIVAQAADMLGFSGLQVYDGSWSEWGALLNLPIQTSSKSQTNE